MGAGNCGSPPPRRTRGRATARPGPGSRRSPPGPGRAPGAPPRPTGAAAAPARPGVGSRVTHGFRRDTHRSRRPPVERAVETGLARPDCGHAVPDSRSAPCPPGRKRRNTQMSGPRSPDRGSRDARDAARPRDRTADGAFSYGSPRAVLSRGFPRPREKRMGKVLTPVYTRASTCESRVAGNGNRTTLARQQAALTLARQQA